MLENRISRLFSVIIVVIFLIITFFIAAFFILSDRPGEKVTLEQAQMEVGFTIYAPTYLPEGVELFAIRWMNEENKDSLFLGYLKENKPSFDLIESMLEEPMKVQHGAEIDISGNIGHLEKTMDSIYLSWHQDNTELCISTMELSEDEILKIARSVKQYD